MKYIVKIVIIIITVILALKSGKLFAGISIDTTLNVGDVEAQAKVDLAGAFTYNIPIKVPPGTAGMEPDLSLKYSSQSGNGICGYGWSLSGLSSITRGNKTIYTDDIVEGIDLDKDDAYYLNGQRLILESGIYGEDSSVYKTEIESYQKVTLYNLGNKESGPDWFKVETKDGKTIEYGTNEAKLITADSSAVITWNIKKVYDRNSNYMLFSYNSINEQMVLDRISYTGNYNEGLTPYNEIQFVYESRSDIQFRYLHGEKLVSNNKLKYITSYTQSQHYRSYELDYDDDGIYTYLKSFHEIGVAYDSPEAISNRLNPITFEYGEGVIDAVSELVSGTIGFQPADPVVSQQNGIECNNIPYAVFTDSLVANLNFSGDYMLLPSNLNGDALTDFIYLEITKDPTNINFGYYSKIKFCYNTNNTSIPGFHISDVSNELIGIQGVTQPFIDHFQIHNLITNNPDYHEIAGINNNRIKGINIKVGDLNGDGIDDFVIGLIEGDVMKYNALITNGQGLYNNYNDNTVFNYDLNDPGHFHIARLGDIDLDGRSELMVFNSEKDSSNISTLAFYITSFNNRVNHSCTNVEEIPSDFYLSDYNIYPVNIDNDPSPEIRLVPNNGSPSGNRIYTYDLDNNLSNCSLMSKLLNTTKTNHPELQDWGDHVFEEISFNNYNCIDLNNDGISDDIFTYSALGNTVFRFNKAILPDSTIINGYYLSAEITNPSIDPINSNLSSVLTEGISRYYFDINSDGFVDILDISDDFVLPDSIGIEDCVLNHSDYTIYLNKGAGNDFEVINFKNVGFEMDPYEDHIQFIDLDGDGNYEILINNFSGTVPNIIKFNLHPTRSRLLHKVYDSYANETKISYQKLSSGNNYNFELNGSYPSRITDAGIFVVDTLSIPDGKGGLSKTTFFYEDLWLNSEGKGIMGFKKVVSENDLNHIRVENINILNSDSSSLIPNISRTIYMSHSDNPNDIILKENIQNYSYLNIGGQRKALRLNESVKFDFINSTKTVSTISNYDLYGNPTLSETKVYDLISDANGVLKNSSSESVNYFDCDWWASYLPETKTTTNYRNGSLDTYSRSSTNNYDVVTGNILSTITDPGTSNEIINSFQMIDSFGNALETIVSVTDPEYNCPDKFARVEYDPTGRYIIKRYNNDNVYTAFYSYNKFGKLNYEIDIINDKSISNSYDNYGRIIGSAELHFEGVNDLIDINSNISYQWNINNDLESLGLNLNSVFKITENKSNQPMTVSYFDDQSRNTLSKEKKSDNNFIYTYYQYDRKGNLVEQSDPFEYGDHPNKTEYEYINDSISLGRLRTITKKAFDPVSGYTSFSEARKSYNNLSRTTDIFENQIHQKMNVKDATGMLITSQDIGGYLNYFYSSNNNLKYIYNTDGILLTEYDYDEYGRQIKLIDKNAGTTFYEYNPYDQLISQTDAKGNITKMTYDRFGRLGTKQIIEINGDSLNYIYEYYDVNENGAYQLKKITTPNAYSTSYVYNNNGSLISKTDSTGDQVLTTSYNYDINGNIEKLIYPSGLIEDLYYNDQTGIMDSALITYNGNTRLVYTLNNYNSYGQVLNYDLGTNINTTKTYNDAQMPEGIFSMSSSNSELVFAQMYNFDINEGNLLSRTDVSSNGEINSEDFIYDNLDRLTHINNIESVQYASNGNINFKIDAGIYNYDNEKINAVKNISNESPSGDPLASSLIQQDVSYTSFDRPKNISEGVNLYDLHYGPGNERKKTILNGSTIRYYQDNYELLKKDDKTYQIHYLSYTNSIDAIFVTEEDVSDGAVNCPPLCNSPAPPSENLYFVFTDYLGSVLKLTDENANSVLGQNFDAWGRRRSIADWSIYLTNSQIQNTGLEWFNRGYTGHEMLYDFCLINMNNRLYDPVLGRFLAVDNYISDLENTQSYNRYSYALNNPLKYTDPSGEFVFSALLPGIGTFIDVALLGAVIGGAGYTASIGFSDGGFRNWDNGQFWKSVGVGALTATVTAGIGNAIGPIGFNGVIGEVGRATMHGFSNGFIAGLTGGEFEQGFGSGFLSSLSGSAFMSYGGGMTNNQFSNYAFSGIAGGIGSETAGGDFWEGAAIGVMNAGLNHLQQGVSAAIERRQMIKTMFPEPGTYVVESETIDMGGLTKLQVDGEITVRKNGTINKKRSSVTSEISGFSGSIVHEQTTKVEIIHKKWNRYLNFRVNSRTGIGFVIMDNKYAFTTSSGISGQIDLYKLKFKNLEFRQSSIFKD